MARATRSSTQQQSQTQNASAKAGSNPAPALKGSKKAHTSKKRKRPSAASADIDPELADTDNDDDAQDQPAAKHPRPEPTFKGAADTPLQPQDAVQILNVLESIDSQGLLDRAFPPPVNDGPSSSRTTLSLRQLLLDAQNHPLRALRDAVQPLLPLTSHARSHDSSVAQEQKQFCSLALALLEQASRHTLDLSSTSAFEDGEHPVSLPPAKRKYALMQKLPNGEWWTSPLSSDDPRARLSAREARALKHGEAELVSILPSAIDPLEDADVPSLDGYAPGPKKDKRKAKQPQGINVPTLRTGSFLDYGPWASFAPSFDSDAAEVGRDALGALYDARARRRIARQIQAQELLQNTGAATSADEDAMQVDEEQTMSSSLIDPALSAATASSGPTATEDMTMLANDIMADLELEHTVSELLQSNARAIADLEVMQLQRLSQGGAPVEEGSDEWMTANHILDTLALLASLRPRIPDSDQSPLVPSPQILHALQRTLPLEASAGFKGTLADGRQSALRDNNTVRVKVAGTATATTTSTTTKAAVASASTAPSPATPAQRFPPGVPYPFPPPTHPYYPNANYQSANSVGTPAAPTPGQPFAAYPGYYPGYYPYPFAPPPRDKAMSMEAAQKFYAYGAQGAAGNAAKAGTPGQNGWPAYPGMPVTLPPHLRRYPAQPFPGTPTPAGR